MIQNLKYIWSIKLAEFINLNDSIKKMPENEKCMFNMLI